MAWVVGCWLKACKTSELVVIGCDDSHATLDQTIRTSASGVQMGCTYMPPKHIPAGCPFEYTRRRSIT